MNKQVIYFAGLLGATTCFQTLASETEPFYVEGLDIRVSQKTVAHEGPYPTNQAEIKVFEGGGNYIKRKQGNRR